MKTKHLLLITLVIAMCTAVGRTAAVGSLAAHGHAALSQASESDIYVPLALNGEARSPWQLRTLSKGPLSPRAYPFAVWTGEEMLVLGGITKPCPPIADCWGIDPGRLDDGAAYDPLTDTWRRVAVPDRELGPDYGLSGPAAFALDGTVYVRARRPGGLLAYRPATDAWSTADVPGLTLNDRVLMVSWEDRLFFLAAEQDDGDEASVVSWRPGDNTSTVLPPPPLPPLFDVTLAAADDWVVLLGAEIVPNPGSGRPSLLIGAIYRESVGWRRLPDSELLHGVWPWLYAGGRLVCTDEREADGGAVGNWGRYYPFGGMLDIATLTWLPLPERPAPGMRLGGVITSDLRDTFAVGDRIVSDDGLLFDPAHDSWEPLPETTVSGRNGTAVAWTGSELLIWGGVTWLDTGEWFPVAELHSDGAAITPPKR